MKLLNYNELKTLLLEERDKIPLTVPGARYEMNIPQPNKHGESMRGGIRIALRCMERCQPLTLDDLRPKGRWKNDGHCSYCGMRNPTCRTDDLADYFPVPDVVFQHLQFCPDCGADMRGGGEDG